MSIHPFFILKAAESISIPFYSAVVFGNGDVIGPSGKKLAPVRRPRRSMSGFDYTVCLKVGDRYRNLNISRILCATFYGVDLDGKWQANHLNKDTSDNRLSNVSVCTPIENCKHRDIYQS